MLGVHQTLLNPLKGGQTQAEIGTGHRPNSLTLLHAVIGRTKDKRLLSYKEHVKCEAYLAVLIVNLIRSVFPEDSIFVATPHGIKRHAVKEILKSQPADLVKKFEALRLQHTPAAGRPLSRNAVTTVDTIERLQGDENK